LGQERGGLGGEERGLGAVVRRQRRGRCDALRGWCVGLDGAEQQRGVELGMSGGEAARAKALRTLAPLTV